MICLRLLFELAKIFVRRRKVNAHEIAEDYNGVADGYNKIFAKEMEEYTKELVEHINPKDNNLVIDLGCGTGKIMEILFEKNKNLKFIGVDLSKNMLSKVRIKAELVNEDIIEFLKKRKMNLQTL